MKDLDCDYYGSSLHKWLSAPLGSGMLYVRKEKIDTVWPLLAAGELEPNDMNRHGGIGNVGIEGTDPNELADTLFRDYRIFTVGIGLPGVRGLRITPNLYTTTEELDALVGAIKELSS
jgi:selenocysteine lyase/cysteine desulfurase